MNFNYNNKSYDVEIIKKNNKNIYIRVKNSKIIVTCNYFTTKKMIEKLLKDNYKSIIKMIEHDNKKQEKDSKFYFFGKEYNVVYGLDFSIEESKIYAKNEKDLTKNIDKIIKDKFYERLMYYYNMYEENIPLPTLRIRKMTTRWGVCNIKTHVITLNYNLYKYDLKCLDYVVVHELSHLIHPNHSASFWAVVEKYCPNYKLIRKTLKDE